MNKQEINQAAWKEFLAGAESALDDWIDEEGEYVGDADAVRARQREILAELKALRAGE